MKNQLTVFPAIFTFEDGKYTVDFIDLKGCITHGNSIQNVYKMAQEAMGLYLDNMTNFPKTTLDISKIKLEKINSSLILVLIWMNTKKQYQLFTSITRSIKR